MNVQLKPQDFDVTAARKALARAIEIKRATGRDIDQMTIVIPRVGNAHRKTVRTASRVFRL